MAGRIEDYAIIADTKTVALVERGGSIDWWCVPRIDSGACFAALLGDESNGRWLLCPDEEIVSVRRWYRHDTLVLETEFETASGTVAVVDFMAPPDEQSRIFRIVEGRDGTVPMKMELVVRFDYGSIVPWVNHVPGGQTLVAGSDGLRFHAGVPVKGEGMKTVASFSCRADQQVGFSLACYDAQTSPPLPLDAHAARARAESWWRDWAGRCTYDGEWGDEVLRSLLTLKALSYSPSGAIAAAATTSLPELVGGVRNWDYRYSWLRDASFALQALVLSGYAEEAQAWYRWLRRAVAGSPGDFQIMYGVTGERRLTEIELDWLPGYEGSRPVRVGNAASSQVQLDVYGEVLDATWTAVQANLVTHAEDLPVLGHRQDAILPALMEHLERVWEDPDDGIWEIRGPRRQFVHSKVMVWVAFDRAVRIAEHLMLGDAVPLERWTELRDTVHADICNKGWNADKNSFVQFYGADVVDASLLMLPRVGFLPPDDPRILGTIDAIQADLLVDGVLLRYPTRAADTVDGLPPGEGAFLMTTFWLVDALALVGRHEEARALFERLLDLRNDVGLLSEEYDPKAERMLGNFPQAFSHLGLVVSAANLSSGAAGPFGDL
ncbi:glycoside hydrolase family 15 protein [Mumia sp. zg.B53]|uniref:glycoside hydrolase family 15 protein n=1 Tax=unclassified Mumia TaxID=2621872 RepID=UPI001C6F05B4|nr:MULTISPECIES: glycoside hydrolase family 15 protein [unclassified Mumia]MBW9205884.1 glycoside hydrolase family 15 protein [Mumia sp. zg.B17]MBW9216066.1 glycoside hydrolase family 15 protein [Mumia sp. zg.B53]